MIVVDASAAVQALLHNGEARRYMNTGHLAAPHLIDAKVLQTIRRLVAHSTVSDADADRIVLHWSQLGVRRFASHILIERIWALRHNVSAYNASYVALAEALECALFTADARLAGAPGLKCSLILVSH